MYNSSLAVLKGIKANFSQLMNVSQNGTFDKLITRVNSTSDKEKYWIPEALPSIKEWIDQRHFGNFTDKELVVTNKEYDDGLRVDRFTLDDSREYLGGNVEMWIKTLVDTYKGFPDELCQTLLTANSNAFDATAFFATSRPNLDNSNTINNLLTGTSSTTYSLAEFTTDYAAAKAGLLGLRDKHDRAINKNAKLAVVVPTHMEDVARTLLAQSQQLIYISSVQSNLYALDNTEIIVNYEQTTSSDNDWYLVNLNAPFKPFLIQDREAPKWEMWDDTKNRFIDYGFYFRIGYSFLNPFAMIKTNN